MWRHWCRSVVVAAGAALLACGGGGAGAAGPETPAPAGGTLNTTSPVLMGCTVFPADNPWNRDVSADPVDPRSDAYIASIGAGRFLHPDFGSDPTYGIPWTTVPGTQPRVPMSFDFDDESDPGPYPFPPDAPVEAGRRSPRPRPRPRCLSSSTRPSTRSYVGRGLALRLGRDLRPALERAAPGRLDERRRRRPAHPARPRPPRRGRWPGEIRHALRFTVPPHPARATCTPPRTSPAATRDPDLPPMGMRVRLKAVLRHRPLPRAGPRHPARAQALRDVRGRQRRRLVHQRRDQHGLERRRARALEDGPRLRVRGRAAGTRSAASPA